MVSKYQEGHMEKDQANIFPSQRYIQYSILSSLITIVQGKDCKKRNTHPPPPPTPPPTPQKKGNKLRAQHREMKEGA